MQVSGAGFAALIVAAAYNLGAGYAAARRRDIAQHQRCMVRMVGLAYGVFPFKPSTWCWRPSSCRGTGPTPRPCGCPRPQVMLACALKSHLATECHEPR